MKKIDFEQAEIDCQKCDYVFAASGTDENPVIWAKEHLAACNPIPYPPMEITEVNN